VGDGFGKKEGRGGHDAQQENAQKKQIRSAINGKTWGGKNLIARATAQARVGGTAEFGEKDTGQGKCARKINLERRQPLRTMSNLVKWKKGKERSSKKPR